MTDFVDTFLPVKRTLEMQGALCHPRSFLALHSIIDSRSSFITRKGREVVRVVCCESGKGVSPIDETSVIFHSNSMFFDGLPSTMQDALTTSPALTSRSLVCVECRHEGVYKTSTSRTEDSPDPTPLAAMH